MHIDDVRHVGISGCRWAKTNGIPTPLDLCFFIIFLKNIFEIFSIHHFKKN